jgi:hypothetical protein
MVLQPQGYKIATLLAACTHGAFIKTLFLNFTVEKIVKNNTLKKVSF